MPSVVVFKRDITSNSVRCPICDAEHGMDPSTLEARSVLADNESTICPSEVGTTADLIRENDNAEVDPLLVTWNGDDDPENPYNWTQPRKWVITVLLSFGGLVTLMSGAMLAPALKDIARDFGTDENHAQIFLSIYVLAFSFGPMVLAPCTEVFGRRPVWLICGCFYIAWNTAAGFSQTSAVLILCRAMSGIGASAEFAVTSPVLADIWTSDQRGKSYAVSTFLPLLGPALGPILGGTVSQKIHWRWIFFILSIYDGILILVGLFLLPETNKTILLERKAKRLRSETGLAYYTSDSHQKLSSKLAVSLTRPLRLLLTHPTIQFMGIILAYNFGLLYIVLSTFATLWIDRYGQTKLQSGLHYIALVIGYTIAAQVGSRAMDFVWAYLKKRAGGTKTAPEYRVPLMVPGAILVLVGIFTYGWTAEYRVHWIGPDIGIAIYGCGIIMNTQAMQAYVTESYLGHVASASAASQFLRSITGFAFPIFAPALYKSLGYGWGNSVLGLAFFVLAAPAPIILWYFGARMRAMSKVE